MQNITDIGDHKGDAMVWLILCLNFTCFVVITVCYVIINILTRRSSERSGASQNESIVDQNRNIQIRISAIIATDFLCWVPLSLICVLHNLKAIDATDWYANFTMVALPINSVINPLLYDNTLIDFVTKKLQNIKQVVVSFDSDVLTLQTLQKWERSEMEAAPTLAVRAQESSIDNNRAV